MSDRAIAATLESAGTTRFFLAGRRVGTQAFMESTMEDNDIRMAIDRHWLASAAGDLAVEHAIYHDDVVCTYPQSGEVIHGRHALQALRSHHPGKPSGFKVRRITGEGDLWVTEYVIDYESKCAFTVSIMEFFDGKVARETQYFADPFSAPAWRAQWVEADSRPA